MFHAVYLVQRHPRFVPVCHVALNFSMVLPQLRQVGECNWRNSSLSYLLRKIAAISSDKTFLTKLSCNYG